MVGRQIIAFNEGNLVTFVQLCPETVCPNEQWAIIQLDNGQFGSNKALRTVTSREDMTRKFLAQNFDRDRGECVFECMRLQDPRCPSIISTADKAIACMQHEDRLRRIYVQKGVTC